MHSCSVQADEAFSIATRLRGVNYATSFPNRDDTHHWRLAGLLLRLLPITNSVHVFMPQAQAQAQACL